MGTTAIASDRSSAKSRLPRLRFSLRTMFVLMSLGGVVLAPLSYELYQARVVAKEASVIREMNGQYWLRPRQNQFSAWLARKLWLRSDQFLGQEIAAARFGPDLCELSRLREVPSLRELSLSGPVVVADPEFAHGNIRELRLSALGEGELSDSYDDCLLFTRFPQAENILLDRVVPSQLLIDALASCREARQVRLIFDTQGRQMARVDLAPLGRLKRMRQLRIIHVADGTEWTFLAELTNLEDVWLCPTGMYSLGSTLEHWIDSYGPLPPRERSPLHSLAELRSLKKVELYGTPAYQEDLERLLANSPIEELRLDVLPSGLASLRVLQKAKSLKKLHVSVSFFGEEAEAARALLESLPVTELSLGPPWDDRR